MINNKLIILIIIMIALLFGRNASFAASRLTGVELRVDDSELVVTQNRVGIGTTAPIADLDVVGAALMRSVAGFRTEYTVSGSGATVAINWNNSNKYRLVIPAGKTTSVTAQFTNPSITGIACTLTLLIEHNDTGDIIWPASVKWPGGITPTLSNSGIDIISFYYYNNTYYGSPTYDFQ